MTKRKAKSAGSTSGAEVQAVVVLTQILDVLGAIPHPMTAAEVAERLGMTRSRVWRYLGTLRQLDLVYQLPNEDLYRLGWKLHRLGQLATRRHPSAILAPEHLSRLHQSTRLSASYLLLAKAELMVLFNFTTLSTPAIAVPISSSIPLFSSASGRVILAYNDPKTREGLIAAANARGETGFDGGMRQLHRRLDLIRGRGYEVVHRFGGLNVNVIAAPVFEKPGQAVATLSLLGTPESVAPEPDAALVGQLIQAADELSQRSQQTLLPEPQDGLNTLSLANGNHRSGSA